jgi:hypothetical protein
LSLTGGALIAKPYLPKTFNAALLSLAANARPDDAASEAREIDVKRLVPEEAALIANIAR